MNKIMLEERIKTLEIQKINVTASVHAIDGAIQDCKFWLEKLEIAEKEKNVNSPTQ